MNGIRIFGIKHLLTLGAYELNIQNMASILCPDLLITKDLPPSLHNLRRNLSGIYPFALIRFKRRYNSEIQHPLHQREHTCKFHLNLLRQCEESGNSSHPCYFLSMCCMLEELQLAITRER